MKMMEAAMSNNKGIPVSIKLNILLVLKLMKTKHMTYKINYNNSPPGQEGWIQTDAAKPQSVWRRGGRHLFNIFIILPPRPACWQAGQEGSY
jgi:hypothetical protein